MATSGVSNYTINEAEIFRDVMETINELGTSDALTVYDVRTLRRKLNMMVKSWMKQGMHLWAMSEATLFLVPGQQTYSLSSTGDNCTNSYVHTTLTADALLGATSLFLDNIEGMTAGDKIGITLDDGSTHWTTIVGAPASPTVIASGLARTASDGAVVFAYTNKINRPLRVISAYWRDINNADTPVDVSARQDYADLSNKMVRGKVNQIFYNPQLGSGQLSVWPTADLATDVVRFWYERPLEDFVGVDDTPDFPIEWAEAICAGLAWRMAVVCGLPSDRLASFRDNAAIQLDLALGFDKEDTSLFFQPDNRQ